MYISDAQWRCGDPYRAGFQPIDRVVNDVIAVTSEPGEISVRADSTFLAGIGSPTPSKPADPVRLQGAQQGLVREPGGRWVTFIVLGVLKVGIDKVIAPSLRRVQNRHA